ncbi:MAG: transcriptional regulator TrmB [Parcubacteria group bacterium Athens0714_16]|nr:MAG: transcriptional regulator TrmB [Parcubacteria group bacterium Athens0714_16]
MKNTLQKDLLDAGLTENESGIYLAALELGETTVSRLAKKAGVKRTTAYLVIESLKDKGLITSIKKEAASVFFAEDPHKLHSMLEERRNKIDKIMPQLLAFSNLIDKKPEIRYFEGEEGIKDVYRDSLKFPDQEMLTWYSEAYVKHFDEKFFLEDYIPRRLKKKISVRAILQDSEAIRSLIDKDQQHLRRTKIVSKDEYNVSIELNIYGNNKVGVISYEEEFGLIIESKKIHESLKSIFELVWGLLPD